MQAAHLQSVYGVPPALARAWQRPMLRGMLLADISTQPRAAAFLAQVGHESGRLAYTREIWGPTVQQKRYDPVTMLAGRLGNIAAGDGRRYMGRGLLQTTGRANYALTTVLLRELLGARLIVPDFEAEPARLQEPQWAALSAGLFWRAKKLNRWADAGDFAELTRRINGGHTGLADRQALYTRALLLPGLVDGLEDAANEMGWRVAA